MEKLKVTRITMDLQRFTLLLLVLKISIISISCVEDFNVELDSFEGSKQYDTKYIDWDTLQMRKIGRNQFAVNGTFRTNLNLGNEQKINLQIFSYDAEHKLRGPLLFNFENEMCKFIAEDENFYPGLKEVSNMPERDVCPVPKAEYYIKDYVFKTDFLPEKTPKGDYYIWCKLKDALKVVAALEAYVVVT